MRRRIIFAAAAIAFILTILVSAFDLGRAEDSITVGPGMDYESFTQAVFETYDSGREIIVFPGLYDIKAEYQRYFGIETLDDNTPLDYGFQMGIRIHDRRIVFMPGAKLRCVWNFPTDFTARFCPLYVGPNTTLDGLDLYAEGTMYAIHDDPWVYAEPYINRYVRCRVTGKNLFNNNCIGGGVTQHSRIIIDNCYFDNGVSNTMTIRYHNSVMKGTESDIWISNSFFNSCIGLTYYGEESHINVYINSCDAELIIMKQETDVTYDENIDLWEWQNDTMNVYENIYDSRKQKFGENDKRIFPGNFFNKIRLSFAP